MEDIDGRYMQRAMSLAGKGGEFVHPNPLVGAVIVKEGRVIGEGWHERFGGWHAERNALKNCTESPAGATIYVTLEPCCHYGKTPPCTEAILEAGITRVVIGLTDPNPLVAGKGIKILREAGIEVVAGVEEQALREQNRIFLKYMTTGMPWVVMKTAMTLDGKIAAGGGDSQWVTGEEARGLVQRMRGEYMAIMAGIGTVKADDPMLNCRLEGEHRQPVRVVVDARAEIDLESRLVTTAGRYRTVIAYTGEADSEKRDRLRAAGCEPLLCLAEGGRVDIGDLLRQLGMKGVDSVLLEGGGELNYAFIEKGYVDEVFAFIAPKIIGGRDAKTPVEGNGFLKMKEAIKLTDTKIERIGDDFLISGKPKY